MSIKSSEKSRDQRAELTKQAIAEIVRTRIADRRLRQTTIARASGISRTHLRSLLRGEKQMSIFIFLELSAALGFDDACQLLRSVGNTPKEPGSGAGLRIYFIEAAGREDRGSIR